MSKTNTGTRFKIIDAPQALPGHCGICGYGGTERQYVDTQLSFEFYGALIICMECAESFAAAIGFLSPREEISLTEALDSKETEIIQLRGIVNNLGQLNAISDNLRLLGFVAPVVTVPVPEIRNQEPATTSDAEGPGVSKSKKSPAVEGPTDLRSATGDNGPDNGLEL